KNPGPNRPPFHRTLLQLPHQHPRFKPIESSRSGPGPRSRHRRNRLRGSPDRRWHCPNPSRNPSGLHLRRFFWRHLSAPRRTRPPLLFSSAPLRYTAIVRVTDGIATVSSNFPIIAHYPLTGLSPPASKQMLYDSVRTKVWCVNPDSDTVSRINATTLAKDMELA